MFIFLYSSRDIFFFFSSFGFVAVHCVAVSLLRSWFPLTTLQAIFYFVTTPCPLVLLCHCFNIVPPCPLCLFSPQLLVFLLLLLHLLSPLSSTLPQPPSIPFSSTQAPLISELLCTSAWWERQSCTLSIRAFWTVFASASLWVSPFSEHSFASISFYK